MVCTGRKISRLAFCENEALCDHNVCVSAQLLLLLSSSFFDSTDQYQPDVMKGLTSFMKINGFIKETLFVPPPY